MLPKFGPHIFYLTLAMSRVSSGPLPSASPVSPTIHMPSASPFYSSKVWSIAVSFPTWLRVTTLSTVISHCRSTISFSFSNNSTSRGHSLKLNVPISRTETRKYFFSARVVKIWNALPANLVHAPSIHSFKKQINNFNFNDTLVLPTFIM